MVARIATSVLTAAPRGAGEHDGFDSGRTAVVE
jgi:hypothetical protein